jgi:phage terminase large subunit-like protein
MSLKLYVCKGSGKTALQNSIMLNGFVLNSHKRSLTTVLSADEAQMNSKFDIV